MYDPKTVETVKGEVVKVDRLTPMKGMSAGIHLLVKTEKEEISVHLGPEWYLLNQDVKIGPGDVVEIKGARTTFQGKAAIIAAEVRKGTDTLKLRDDAGVPVWAGWRRG
jgi:DNA helicase TIP49 (TBP-interacting protein)